MLRLALIKINNNKKVDETSLDGSKEWSNLSKN